MLVETGFSSAIRRPYLPPAADRSENRTGEARPAISTQEIVATQDIVNRREAWDIVEHRMNQFPASDPPSWTLESIRKSEVADLTCSLSEHVSIWKRCPR